MSYDLIKNKMNQYVDPTDPGLMMLAGGLISGSAPSTNPGAFGQSVGGALGNMGALRQRQAEQAQLSKHQAGMLAASQAKGRAPNNRVAKLRADVKNGHISVELAARELLHMQAASDPVLQQDLAKARTGGRIDAESENRIKIGLNNAMKVFSGLNAQLRHQEKNADRLSVVNQRIAANQAAGSALGRSDANSITAQQDAKTAATKAAEVTQAKNAVDPQLVSFQLPTGKTETVKKNSPKFEDYLAKNYPVVSTRQNISADDTVSQTAQERTQGKLRAKNADTGREGVRKNNIALGSLRALKRTIAEKGDNISGLRGSIVGGAGGLVEQIFGKDAAKSLSKLVATHKGKDVSPEERSAFALKARQIVAANITAVTGEESGRFTEMERRISEAATRLIDPTASSGEIAAALDVLTGEQIILRDYNRAKIGQKPKHDLTKKSGVVAFLRSLEKEHGIKDAKLQDEIYLRMRYFRENDPGNRVRTD